jgi:hypothetical protein
MKILRYVFLKHSVQGLFLILSLFITTLSYCPPKLDKQQSSLDVIEKNYNKFAYVSGGLLLVSAALNYNKLMVHANSYYLQFKPYFSQQNLAKASLASGLLLAAPLLYLKVRNKEEKGK